MYDSYLTPLEVAPFSLSVLEIWRAGGVRDYAFNLSMQMQMFVRNRGINKCALCENVCMCVALVE